MPPSVICLVVERIADAVFLADAESQRRGWVEQRERERCHHPTRTQQGVRVAQLDWSLELPEVQGSHV